MQRYPQLRWMAICKAHESRRHRSKHVPTQQYGYYESILLMYTSINLIAPAKRLLRLVEANYGEPREAALDCMGGAPVAS